MDSMIKPSYDPHEMYEMILGHFEGNKAAVARAFGVTPQAVTAWHLRGRIPAKRLQDAADLMAPPAG